MTFKSILEEREGRFYIFLGIWVLLNLVQSVTTGLFHDEALYWAFSEEPAFGYFDHPPFTAWLIALTSWIPGDLGVRLPFILMSAGTMYFLWKILDPRDEWLFIAILVGVPLIHVGGFFAAPDVPLLFLMTAFLYYYKSYFYKDSIPLALLLGLLLGLMGISKYHAILFAIALALSNIEMFKRRSLYLGLLVAAIVVLPHIYWQWQNDWVSFQFHLFSRRGTQPWSWSFFGDYLAGQIGIYGLFLAGVLFAASIKKPPGDHYDCAYKYTFFTVFIFFTLSVFKGRVEANWTAMAFIPMAYLTYLYVKERPNWRRWLMYFAGFSLILTLMIRFVLAFEVLPPDLMKRNETHGFEEWAKKLEAEANGAPVVFTNNYRKPAKYSYYTGQPTYSWNMAKYSGNQYDLWTEDEIALQGERVLMASDELDTENMIEFDHGIGPEKIRQISRWYSFNYLDIKADPPSEAITSELEAGLEITITNTTDFRPVSGGEAVQVQAVFLQYEKIKKTSILIADLDVESIDPEGEMKRRVSFTYPEEPGEYTLKFSILSNGFPGLNSWPYEVSVKEAGE